MASDGTNDGADDAGTPADEVVSERPCGWCEATVPAGRSICPTCFRLATGPAGLSFGAAPEPASGPDGQPASAAWPILHRPDAKQDGDAPKGRSMMIAMAVLLLLLLVGSTLVAVFAA